MFHQSTSSHQQPSNSSQQMRWSASSASTRFSHGGMHTESTGRRHTDDDDDRDHDLPFAKCITCECLSARARACIVPAYTGSRSAFYQTLHHTTRKLVPPHSSLPQWLLKIQNVATARRGDSKSNNNAQSGAQRFIKTHAQNRHPCSGGPS